MPANLTPEYKKADEQYRAATTDQERLLALEEMLRTIPKHKGTEHMQADLKRRISKLREALEGRAKKAGSKTDLFHIPKNGAGQVALIGTPNCGKSSILAALTKAPVHVADYPFSTDKPVPGMALFEDIQIQLIDTPPITPDYAAPGQVNIYRSADLIAIVIDLSQDVLDQMQICLAYLDAHRLILDEKTPAFTESGSPLGRKTFVIATKADIAPAGTLQTLKELTERPLEFIEISTKTGKNLDLLRRRIFEMLDVVRIYAKKPGREPDFKDPFTLPRGSTVMDLAYKIHRDLAEQLKSARAWSAPGIHDGQNVPREHILSDKEIIELHFP